LQSSAKAAADLAVVQSLIGCTFHGWLIKQEANNSFLTICSGSMKWAAVLCIQAVDVSTLLQKPA